MSCLTVECTPALSESVNKFYPPGEIKLTNRAVPPERRDVSCRKPVSVRSISLRDCE